MMMQNTFIYRDVYNKNVTRECQFIKTCTGLHTKWQHKEVAYVLSDITPNEIK